MRIELLVLDGVFDLGLSALLDTFAIANSLSPACEPLFAVECIGVRKRVRTAHGLSVPVQAADACRRAPILLLPALAATTPSDIESALVRKDVCDAQSVLQEGAARGARVGASCGGTFVLAASGLLDGGAATTTWWLAPLFRSYFPQVELDESQMVVPSGRCVTAGAALAHLDLALWLVRSQSAELAAQVARYLVLDPRPSPGVMAIPDHLAHSDAVVEGFERFVQTHMASAFSLDEAAHALATSTRTLSRRVKQVTGKSPIAYVQAMRVERAIHLLRTSDLAVEEIAAEVGYQDGVTLRTLLRRKTGRGVRELRARDWARDT